MPRTWTDEEREEQRQRMLALHAEGRAGAEFGKLGGRPRTKRPQERIAERAANEGDRFYDRMMEIVENGRDGEARKAIMDVLGIVEKERQIEVEEEQRFAELRRAELEVLVARNFAELVRRRVLSEPGSEQIIEGRAREISAGPDGTFED